MPLEEEAHQEILSDSSDDDLKDLMKKFESEYEELKRKKAAKKAAKTSNPPPVTDSHLSRDSTDPFASNGEPPKSAFISKLYSASSRTPAKEIDYKSRRFSWESSELEKSTKAEPNSVCSVSKYSLRNHSYTPESLSEVIGDTKVLRVQKLQAKCHAPKFEEPQYANWCLTGFISAKQEQPRFTAAKKKFFKASVGDFDSTVEVMFFGEAATKYWVLKPGDCVAVLNPSISRYTLAKKSGFTLSIDGDADAVIVLGQVAHFGQCVGENKTTNTRCTMAVDTSKNQMCPFHLDQKHRSVQNKRSELRGSVAMRDPNALRGDSRFGTENEFARFYKGPMAGYKSNPNAYHDPMVINKKNFEKRRKRDEEAKMALERKLAKLNSHNPAIRSIMRTPPRPSPLAQGGSPGSPTSPGRGFSSRMVQAIGFNPANERPDDGVYVSPKRKRTHDIQELYNLSSAKEKEKQLAKSPEERRQKRDKWSATVASLRNHQRLQATASAADSFTKALNSASSSTHASPFNKVISLDSGFSTDESDVEIEFGNEDAKKDFQARLQALRKEKNT
ncbi:hypothetical protein DICA3_E05974 [Diutina catenulata]